MIDLDRVTAALGDSIERRVFSPGDVVFRENDPGSSLFILEAGIVELLLGDQLLDMVEPGHVFGEMSAVDGDRRSATALASGPCEAFEIDQQVFLNLIHQEPGVAIEIMRIMARRIRRLNTALAIPKR